MELYTIVCNSSMCLLQSLSTQNRVWLAKNENSNIYCYNWVIANFILTTNLCVVVLSHKDNQVICDKSSWYKLSRLFEYYFIIIIIIVIIIITIFPFIPHTILEYYFLPSLILSLCLQNTLADYVTLKWRMMTSRTI